MKIEQYFVQSVICTLMLLGGQASAANHEELNYLEQITVGLTQCYGMAITQNQSQITKLDALGGDVISFVVLNSCQSLADPYIFYCQRVTDRTPRDCAGDLALIAKDVVGQKHD